MTDHLRLDRLREWVSGEEFPGIEYCREDFKRLAKLIPPLNLKENAKQPLARPSTVTKPESPPSSPLKEVSLAPISSIGPSSASEASYSDSDEGDMEDVEVDDDEDKRLDVIASRFASLFQWDVSSVLSTTYGDLHIIVKSGTYLSRTDLELAICSQMSLGLAKAISVESAGAILLSCPSKNLELESCKVNIALISTRLLAHCMVDRFVYPVVSIPTRSEAVASMSMTEISAWNSFLRILRLYVPSITPSMLGDMIHRYQGQTVLILGAREDDLMDRE